MTPLSFSKYSGCGNDFVLVDNRSSFFPLHDVQLIQHLCQRRDGIGADGIILLEQSQTADYRMRILNSDGSEAEMCGNGIRCLMRFITKLDPTVTSCLIQTAERIIPLELDGELIKASVGSPTDIQWHLPIDLIDGELSAHFLNTGVPHCVVFVRNIDDIDIASRGPFLRRHLHFGHKGTNVNFACNIDGNYHYRTWERGVEGETAACGTGAIAVACAAAFLHNLSSPITIFTHSKQPLHISFDDYSSFINVDMTGPAIHLFDGIWIGKI